MTSLKILGTSITCSTSGKELSRIFSTSTSCSTTSGTGASSIGRTGAPSAICSTVCRCTRSCGPDTAESRSGREPPSSGTLTSSRPWYRVTGSWEVGASGIWPCASPRTHLPALAIVCPRGGCVVSKLGQGHRDAQTLVP